jgi:hypothetical protein
MIMRRFGQKLKLPSIVSIKHQILMMMLEDEIRALPAGTSFSRERSPAIAALRRLKNAAEPLRSRSKGAADHLDSLVSRPTTPVDEVVPT